MGLCQTLGLAAVAEGIESESQLEMLRGLGYGSGQGWLFGRPAPAAEVSATLNDGPPPPAPSVARIAEQVALRLPRCMGCPSLHFLAGLSPRSSLRRLSRLSLDFIERWPANL
jgi:hypothetical protein